MREKSFHVPDEDLVLAADNELPARRAAEVRAHLSACWDCRARMAEIEKTISDFVRATRESDADIPSIDGPRALLKARLAQLEPTLPSRPLHRAYVPSFAYVAALLFLMVAGVWLVYQQVRRPVSTYALMLPNSRLTPGVAQPIALSAVCSSDHDDVVRSVPNGVQQAVFREYGISNAPAADYEVDYLITPGLGGTSDIRNLWPEPHNNTAWNSYVKDQLEDRLHNMVCSGQVSLSTAQQEIAANWISAYEKYFHTKRPLRCDLITSRASSVGPAISLLNFSPEKRQQNPAALAPAALSVEDPAEVSGEVPAGLPSEGAAGQRVGVATLLLVLSCVFALLIHTATENSEEIFRFLTQSISETFMRAQRQRLPSHDFPLKISTHSLQVT